MRVVSLLALVSAVSAQDCSLASVDGVAKTVDFDLTRVSTTTPPVAVNCLGTFPFFFSSNGAQPSSAASQNRVVISDLNEFPTKLDATFSFFVQGGANLGSGQDNVAPIFGYGRYKGDLTARCGIFLSLASDFALFEASVAGRAVDRSALFSISPIKQAATNEFTHFSLLFSGGSVKVIRDCQTVGIRSIVLDNPTAVDFEGGLPDCSDGVQHIATLGDFDGLLVANQKGQFDGRIDRVRMFARALTETELSNLCDTATASSSATLSSTISSSASVSVTTSETESRSTTVSNSDSASLTPTQSRSETRSGTESRSFTPSATASLDAFDGPIGGDNQDNDGVSENAVFAAMIAGSGAVALGALALCFSQRRPKIVDANDLVEEQDDL